MNNSKQIKIAFTIVLLSLVFLQYGHTQCSLEVDTVCVSELDTLFINAQSDFSSYDWYTDNGASLTVQPNGTSVIVDWSTSSVLDGLDFICVVGMIDATCSDTLCMTSYVKTCDLDCATAMSNGIDICTYLNSNPTSPLASIDCDAGGVSNLTECQNGQNPLDANDDSACLPGEEEIIHQVIKTVGQPTLCDVIIADNTHPLANQDCDNGGIDNLTECQNGANPYDPIDDVAPSCDFDFDMSMTFNDAGTCRFYVTLNCDDSACPISSWDYDISAGSVSITGTSTSNLNAPTSNSFRPSTLACGNTIRITRPDFASAFPAGFGEDITFTLTANSASCGCSKTSSVLITRMRALTLDNQGPQRDDTATTSYIQANGDYVNGSATAMSGWTMPPAPPSWGVGSPIFIAAPYVQKGDVVCGPIGWAQMVATAGMSICEVTLDDGTVINLPAGCAVPAPGAVLSTTIANAFNSCADFLNHPSINGNGLCSSVGTKYDGNLTSGVHACVNWNFMYSTGYAVKTFKICNDATGNVAGEFIFGDASVDYGY